MKLSLTTLFLLAASPLPALAQSIDVDGDRIAIDAAGAQLRTDGSDAGITSVTASKRHVTSKTQASTARSRGGDRHSATVVDGTVVNHAEGAGAVSEQSFGDDTTVARGQTIVTHNGKTTVYGGDAAPSDPRYRVNEDLRGADFAGQRLGGYAFTNSDLGGADLRRADLAGADFVNADLRRARLDGADLRGADLTNARLDDAALDGAVWIDGRVCAQGSRGRCE